MGIASTPRTNFMKRLIRDRDLQRSRLIRDRKKQVTSKRLGDINIKADTSKFALRTIERNIINFDKMANILKQLFKRLLLPQFQRESSNFDPLVNPLDSSRIRIKERFPLTKHQVQTTNMPRTTIPNQGNILNIREAKKKPPIT